MGNQQQAALSERTVTPKQTPTTAEVGDLRFRQLLGNAAWHGLPATVRARFCKRMTGSRSMVYCGEIVETRMSRLGWAFAQFARLIGAPLPTSRDINVPAVVSVTEDKASGGQHWTRLYGHHRGFPQVIHSAKRFAGPTGLEEYVGYSIGMALRVDADHQSLRFHSDHYFLCMLGARLRLPRWLTPGTTTVSHVDLGSGTFAFVLEVAHPRFGELIYQRALFRDSAPE